MVNSWPVVRFGEFLTERKDFFTIDDFERYKRARVRLHAKGIVLRDEIDGIQVKTKKQQAASAKDFLVAEIDAKVGGFGIVPPELNGAIVSSHYFLFEIDEKICLKEWLDWYIRSGKLEVQVNAQGSTNYAAIRPSHVLDYEIPLPTLSEQQRIIAQIESLTNCVRNAQSLRQSASDELERLQKASSFWTFTNISYPSIKISEISKVKRGRGPKYQEGTGLKVINQKCVRWNGINLLHAKEVSEDWLTSLKEDHFLKQHDILVNSTGEGTIGRTCLVTSNAIGLPFDSHVLVIKLKRKDVLPKFVKYYLSGPVGQTLIENTKGAKTTNQTELGVKKLGSIPIPIPPLDEQRRIVAYLDGLSERVNELRRLQGESQVELDALLPSVLDRAFKGEL